MILEAFSDVMKREYRQSCDPVAILHDWLESYLERPVDPYDPISQVIHTEIEMIYDTGERAFEGLSRSGKVLLKSLTSYCISYDHWQFSRWLHDLRASDFGEIREGNA